MEPTTITLAGQSYPVAPLTLGDLIDLRVASAIETTGDRKKDVRAAYERSVAVIAIGLRDAAIDAEALKKLPITEDELAAAQRTILELSGLKFEDRNAAGEAAAAAE